MSTSRQVVRAYLAAGRPDLGGGRRPLLPLAFHHAARFDGAAFEDIAGDAARLSRALVQQRQLLGGDCISVRFDEAWFASAVGLAVEWADELPRAIWSPVTAAALAQAVDAGAGVFATFIDVIDRLCKQLRREAPVLVELPGPMLLASRIGAPGIEPMTEAQRALVERCCRAGAELVVLREPGDIGTGRLGGGRLAAILAPILNTVRYYNATPILWGPERPGPDLPDPALFPAEAAEALLPGRKSGLIVPEACVGDPGRSASFAAMAAALPAPPFLAVPDEALVRHSVEANTEAMRALAA